MKWLSRFARSPSSYSLTGMYLSGVALAVAISEGYIGLGTGLIALTLVAIFGVLVAMWREVRLVHVLVNSQHDELVDRIGQLTRTLQTADIPIPRQPDRRGT